MTCEGKGTNRRTVLAILAAVAAGPALGASEGGTHGTLRAICARAARNPDLATIGQAHLHLHPTFTLRDGLESLARGLPSVEKQIVETLRDRVLSDFRDNRILAIAGWRVSQTESCLCAVGVLVRS